VAVANLLIESAQLMEIPPPQAPNVKPASCRSGNADVPVGIREPRVRIAPTKKKRV